MRLIGAVLVGSTFVPLLNRTVSRLLAAELSRVGITMEAPAGSPSLLISRGGSSNEIRNVAVLEYEAEPEQPKLETQPVQPKLKADVIDVRGRKKK